ncbi:MAG: hypothetical protein SFT93_00650 [Rickettsiaceae bacterium]|nr:hypothetical protein [Rickettsiaceae bacterium]
MRISNCVTPQRGREIGESAGIDNAINYGSIASMAAFAATFTTLSVITASPISFSIILGGIGSSVSFMAGGRYVSDRVPKICADRGEELASNGVSGRDISNECAKLGSVEGAKRGAFFGTGIGIGAGLGLGFVVFSCLMAFASAEPTHVDRESFDNNLRNLDLSGEDGPDEGDIA